MSDHLNRAFQLLLLLGLLPIAGCTTSAVSGTSQRHAAEMMDLEYQQVVDNLARFVWEENSLPSLVTIASGVAQVSDRITPGLSIPFETGFNAERTVSLSAERQWTVNWQIKPVVESDSLVALQGLYREAVRVNIPPEHRNVGHGGGTSSAPAKPAAQSAPWFSATEPSDRALAFAGRYRDARVYVSVDHMEELSRFTIEVLRNSPKISLIPEVGGPALNP